MNNRKSSLLKIVCLAAAATMIATQPLAATNYNVPTGNKDISCTVRTLPQMQMLKLTGDYGPYSITVGTEHANHVTTGVGVTSGHGLHTGVYHTSSDKVIKKTVNYFHLAAKRYMAVLVKIENNSGNTIVLEKDGYLRGIQKAIVPKEEILNLYPALLNAKDTEWGIALGCAICSGLCACFFGFGAISEMSKNVWNALFFGGLAAMFGLVAGGAGYQMQQASETIARAKAKKHDLATSTTISKKRRDDKIAYESDTLRFKVRPNSIFRDIIFIDLKTEDRDVFDEVIPQLDYHVRHSNTMNNFEKEDKEEEKEKEKEKYNDEDYEDFF